MEARRLTAGDPRAVIDIGELFPVWAGEVCRDDRTLVIAPDAISPARIADSCMRIDGMLSVRMACSIGDASGVLLLSTVMRSGTPKESARIACRRRARRCGENYELQVH